MPGVNVPPRPVTSGSSERGGRYSQPVTDDRVEPEDEELEAQKKIKPLRLIITAVVGVGVTVAVFVLLIPELGSYQQAFAELGNMSTPWVIALLAAGVVNLAVYPLTVMVSVERFKYWPSFVERQVGFLVSNAVPGGGVFAVGFQYRVLRHYLVPSTMSAAAVTADAVWTYLITLGIPSLAVILLSLTGEPNQGVTSIALIGLAGLLISIAAIWMVQRSEKDARRVGGWASSLVGWILRPFKKASPDFREPLVRFRNRAHLLIVNRWRSLTVTNVLAEIMPFIIILLALGGLGVFPETISFTEAFAAFAIAQLLVSIPLTPGGLGTVDAALIALLTGFGVPGPTAIAADVLWRLVWFLPSMVAGFGAFIYFIYAQHRPKVSGFRPEIPQAP